ncbi:MAG: HPr family phosphocarrier protein [Sphaerochaetaceae bacterium]|nr:HPr family phosphocarrier protein [Sphaerochaetaceae bacterium]
MIQRILKVSNRSGIHTRPASLIAKTATAFRSSILFKKDGMEINGKSVMGILTLGCIYNDVIEMLCQGPQEVEQADAIESLFASRFEKAYEKEDMI